LVLVAIITWEYSYKNVAVSPGNLADLIASRN